MYVSAPADPSPPSTSNFIPELPRLCTLIIDALLRVWSVTTTSKEVLFLNEVEEVLEMTQPPEFQKIQVALFNRIADCIRSPHFQVPS